MKYVIVLGDGMADEPIAELNLTTPLAAAKTPMMSFLAKRGEIGLVKTIPDGMKPGSDTANLAVLGYDPRIFYSGRSPLEALSIGVKLKEDDVAIRCNLVTLSEGEDYEEKIIIDHSSGEISTEEAAVLLEAVRKEFDNEEFQFYTGTSYRHCIVWSKGRVIDFTQPHDILSQKIGEYLPKEDSFRLMMKRSFDLLNNHPINLERARKGLNKANSIWFWGAGTRPELIDFYKKTGKKGAMISAVDLLKGIAKGAGMRVIDIEGADGTLHTNYEGKAEAAIRTLLEEKDDFVYVHIEAPDEMGHQGSLERKLKAIEYLDERIIKPIYDGLRKSGEPFRMLIMPDHPTPISKRTHTKEPVPYLLYDSSAELSMQHDYNEKEATDSGSFEAEGYRLIEKLFK